MKWTLRANYLPFLVDSLTTICPDFFGVETNLPVIALLETRIVYEPVLALCVAVTFFVGMRALLCLLYARFNTAGKQHYGYGHPNFRLVLQ